MFRPLSKHAVEAELEPARPERPERLGLGKVSPGAGPSWDPRSVYGMLLHLNSVNGEGKLVAQRELRRVGPQA